MTEYITLKNFYILLAALPFILVLLTNLKRWFGGGVLYNWRIYRIIQIREMDGNDYYLLSRHNILWPWVYFFVGPHRRDTYNDPMWTRSIERDFQPGRRTWPAAKKMRTKAEAAQALSNKINEVTIIPIDVAKNKVEVNTPDSREVFHPQS